MPILPVVFTRRAAREVETASAWWSRHRSGAEGAVEASLAAALMLIKSQPACGAPAASRRYNNVRRIHLAQISHHLYYRVTSKPPRLEVLAFWHTRRDKGPAL